jgi:hypothetical protein
MAQTIFFIANGGLKIVKCHSPARTKMKAKRKIIPATGTV